MAGEEVGFFMGMEGDLLTFRRESKKGKRELKFQNSRCVSCFMCHEACPVEAIEVNPSGSAARDLIDAPRIIIDAEKCVLCGICANVCLFGALDFAIDGVQIKELKGYPKYERKWEWYPERCKPKDEAAKMMCDFCEKECPTEALKCSLVEENGKVKNVVQRDEKLCVYCGSCKLVCPVAPKAIETEKVFEGEVKVDLEKCQGCGVCVTICPTESLSMPKPKIGEKVDKLVINKDTCIYCGACVKACPVTALEVKRKNIRLALEGGVSTTRMREKVFSELLTKEVPP